MKHGDLVNERKKKIKGTGRLVGTFIWVRRFWNQNLIWRGSRPSSRLSAARWFSSGCGHSLNILQSPANTHHYIPSRQSSRRRRPAAGRHPSTFEETAKEMETKRNKRVEDRTLRAAESGAGCGGGSASAGAGCRSPQVRRRNPLPPEAS